MAIQTITRQALFKKMAEVVNQLPNEKLLLVWQQFNAWETALAQSDDNKATSNDTDVAEIIEFVVPPRLSTQKPLIRLPMRSTTPVAAAIMEVGEAADNTDTFMQQLRANIEWWNQNARKICNDPTLVGHYVAIANSEVFAGDSYLEAYHNVRQIYPNSVPYIFYLKSAQKATYHAN